MLLTLVGLFIVFSFLVIIHELGHYLAAKWQKIHVEEFGLGYPPLLKRVFRLWGTDFTLNMIPFGGFVKMEGEDGPPDAEAREAQANTIRNGEPFYTKPAWARLIVILAGAFVNIVFGVVAFAIVFSITGIPSGATIAEVDAGSLADQAGIRVGQVVTAVEVDGQRIAVVTSTQLRPQLGEALGKKITILLHNQCDDVLCDSEIAVPLQLPAPDAIDLSNQDQGITGITVDEYTKFYPWYRQIPEGVLFGVKQAVQLAWTILSVVVNMVRDLVTRGQVPAGLAGPVGIATEAHEYHIFSNWVSALLFAGLISINLGVMNILPIPALDGGRAIFILLEKIIGRERVNKVENHLNQYGYIFLVSLMVLITARDIFRLVTGG